MHQSQISDDIFALVLSGGKSSRMQKDKSQIEYRDGISQEAYLVNLCQKIGLETFISKAACSETDRIQGPIPVLYDKSKDIGPIAGIEAAFDYKPNSAWLIISCDFPLISQDQLIQLIEARDPRKAATVVKNRGSGFLEPLLALYESSIARSIAESIKMGKYSLTKLLNTQPIEVVGLDGSLLFNANTPEEEKIARELITKYNL